MGSFCGQCGGECDIVKEPTEDYTAHGLVAHAGVAVSSDCCGADVFIDAELTVPYQYDGQDLEGGEAI